MAFYGHGEVADTHKAAKEQWQKKTPDYVRKASDVRHAAAKKDTLYQICYLIHTHRLSYSVIDKKRLSIALQSKTEVMAAGRLWL